MVSVLDNLSLILGDEDYIFGSRPSSLDACVFSYLHVILSVLPPDSRLKSLVLGHDNLTMYSRRIWTAWYSRVDSLASTLQ